MKTSKITLTWVITTFFMITCAMAQDKKPEQYDFGNIPEYVDIPEEFQGADAVIMHQETTYSIDFDVEYFVKLIHYNITDADTYNYLSDYSAYSGLLTLTLHKRVRILTKNGLDSYSFLSLIDNKYSDILTLDARTIKPDGTVLELNIDDIKQVDLVSGEELEDKENPKKRFAIPGLEIGDEVEFIYTVSGHNLLLVEDFFFYESIPALNTNLTIRLRSGLYPNLYYYNGAVQAKTEVDGIYAVYSWQLQNQPAYNNISNAQVAAELPFVRLVMKEIKWRNGVVTSKISMVPDKWETVFKLFEDNLLKEGDRTTKARSIKNKIEEIKQENPSASNFDLFYKFFRFVNDSVEIRNLEEWEENYKPGYYLYNRFADRNQLYLIYINAMDYLDVNYNLCFGVNITSPSIDTNIVNPFCYDKILLKVSNDDKAYYLYPSTKYRKYEFDEIPVSLEGTTALVFLNKKRDEKMALVPLPQGKHTDNFINRKCQLNIKKDSSETEAIFGFTLSGSASTDFRNKIDKNLLTYKKDSMDILKYIFVDKPEEDVKLKIDTIIKKEASPLFPFKYKFSVNGSYQNLLTQLDDSTYTLPLTPLIEHNRLFVSDYERLVDYIPRYPRMDMYTYFLVFDQPIQILNKEATSVTIENKIGSYQMVVEPVNDKMLLITSKYDISSNFIPKEDYGLLKQLTHAAEDAENATIILKY